MKKLWHWLTFPAVLNARYLRAKELAEFYEQAYFETKRQLSARCGEVNYLRQQLEASKRHCRRCK